jgi:hypothetical protein
MMKALVVSLALGIITAACGSASTRFQELPVMRQPIKILEGGEMWEKWSFSFLVEGPTIFALGGSGEGLSLTTLRQDGEQKETKLVLEKQDAWWDFDRELLGKLCGGEDVFEEATRIVLEDRGIAKDGETFIVAFGAESDLSCKSSREEIFSLANYYVVPFDGAWKPKRDPWKARGNEKLVAFIPVSWKQKAGLLWLTEKAIGFDFAPEGEEETQAEAETETGGEGESFSRPNEMKIEPAWGRNPALAAGEIGGELIFAAAYAEELSAAPVKNSLTIVSLPHASPGDVTVTRLKTALTPTAVELRPCADRLLVLWALTGPVAPAGTIASILRTQIKADGTAAPPDTVFERKDMAGTSLLIKKLASCAEAGRIAVGWVYDVQGMDGIEERIGLFTSKTKDLEGGKVYSYTLELGHRGVRNLYITTSGSQYIILWEQKGLHQIRTAISSI